jgi:U3 small nucleolar RNA-associated protein 14
VDTRKALSAQLKRGDDLLQKMKNAKSGDNSDDSENEDLVESARKVLEDTENDENQEENKGLFKLKFMQRGVEKQREKAKEEARQLLRELEANEKLDDYDEAVMYDSDPDETKPKKRKVASKESMKQVIGEGELVASSLKFGKSNAVSVSGNIDVDLGSSGAVSEYTATMSSIKAADHEEAPASGKAGKKKSKKGKGNREAKEVKESATAMCEEANPWMSAGSDPASDDAKKANKKRKGASALKTGVVDVERVLDVLDGGSQTKSKEQKRENDSKVKAGESSNGKESITMLSQEELVRRAFATSDDKDVEEDFAAEKAEVEDEENDVKTAAQKKKEKDMAVVSGWGSWAGAGAPPPKPPQKLPKHLQPPKQKETKRKRQDAKRPDVIIREKRVRKTADKFMVTSVPYPFKSREEYERAMLGAVGREWNVSQSVKDMTRPEIQTTAGKIIQPLSRKVKKNRAPAKF